MCVVVSLRYGESGKLMRFCRLQHTLVASTLCAGESRSAVEVGRNKADGVAFAGTTFLRTEPLAGGSSCE